jgi:hypothetical protein
MVHRDGADDQRVPEIQAPWKLLRTGKAKIAFSLKELVGLTSEFSVKKAPNCTSQVVRTDPAKFLFVYRVTCGESYSDPNGHVVRMKFDFKRMKETHQVDDLDVRVSCSCPAFLYWGAQWNVSTGDALYGAPRPLLKAPTEPRRYQFVVCKHVKVVADRISPALDNLMARYKSDKDKAQETEKQKQLELVKQQQDAEAKEKEEAAKPITPKTTPVDDLDAMPEDLTSLGLPGKEPEAEPVAPAPPTPAQPTRPPITRKKPKPTPELEPKPVPTPEPEAEQVPPGSKHPKDLPANITLVDDEDQGTTIIPGESDVDVLPGKKRRPMLRQEEAKEPARGRKAPKGPAAPQKARPSLAPPMPSNVTFYDDDDDTVTKINRLKASLQLAGVV